MKTKLNLVDIAGLDRVSFWPLAIGWWILFAALVVSALAAVGFILLRKRRMQSLQYRLLQELNDLEKKLSTETSQQAATELSALIRRLALYRHPRSVCASLEGEDWLKWLTEHDAKKFNWSEHAKILLVAPFQKSGSVFDTRALHEAIFAAKGWIK
jgi:hypothetical protein